MTEEILNNTSSNVSEENKSLKLEILDKMSSLATAGFGLVAALAWNDAIKSLFDVILPQTGTIIAQFIYAGVITIIIVLITIKLGKLTDIVKKTSLKINIRPNLTNFKKK